MQLAPMACLQAAGTSVGRLKAQPVSAHRARQINVGIDKTPNTTLSQRRCKRGCLISLQRQHNIQRLLFCLAMIKMRR